MTDETQDTPELEAPTTETDATPETESDELIETPDTDEAEPSGDDEQPDEQPRFTVKLAGKEIEVTLDELRNGYQRQQDYTAKTMALAEREKEITARVQKYDGYLSQSENLIRAMHGELQSEFANVNWQQLADNDPAEYVRLSQRRAAKENAIRAALQQHTQLQQAKEAETTEQTTKRIESERKALLDKLPEWRDPAKASAGIAEVRAFMAETGYSADEIENVTDHRDVLLARDAMLYRRLMSKVPKAKPAPQAPPPPTPVKARGKSAPDPEKMSMDDWLKWRTKQLKERA